MSFSVPYCHAEAFIQPGQIDRDDDGVLCQLVSVMMVDDTGEVQPAECALTARQARELAFHLLVCAEHAEQITRAWEAGR